MHHAAREIQALVRETVPRPAKIGGFTQPRSFVVSRPPAPVAGLQSPACTVRPGMRVHLSGYSPPWLPATAPATVTRLATSSTR
jgi:hypothetical protein